MKDTIEKFSYSPQAFSAELTAQSHQVLYWLNRNGYLNNEDTTDLLERMIVVPIRNNKKFGQRLLERFFGKDANERTYVFPITLLEDKDTYEAPEKDKPTLTVVK